MSTDPYEILGVPRDADADTIKKAYRKLARTAAPRRQPGPGDARSGSRRSPAPTRCCPTPRSAGTTTWAATPSPAASASGAGFSFTDIMDAFFGGGGGGAAQGRGPRPRVRRGQDALIHLEIDLAEAAFGTTRELKVDTAVLCTDLPRRRRCTRHPPGHLPDLPGPRRDRSTSSGRSSARSARCGRAPPAAASARSSPSPCRECSGDGRVRSRRTLTVKIPAGVDDGTRVQLAEQGEVGPGGGPAGDLYVELHVTDARRVRPQGPRPALHGHAADDRRGARRLGDAADAGVRPDARRRPPRPASPSPPPTEVPLEIRAGTQSGSEIVLPGTASPPCAAAAAATSSSGSSSRRRPGSTSGRRSCCASSPRSAARRSRPGRSAAAPQVGVRPAPRRLRRVTRRR